MILIIGFISITLLYAVLNEVQIREYKKINAYYKKKLTEKEYEIESLKIRQSR